MWPSIWSSACDVRNTRIFARHPFRRKKLESIQEVKYVRRSEIVTMYWRANNDLQFFFTSYRSHSTGANTGHRVWRAVCFKITFVSFTISLSFSLNFLFSAFIEILWYKHILCQFGTHHSIGCSCTGYKLSVINLHSVGCTHSSVAVSCKYLQ